MNHHNEPPPQQQTTTTTMNTHPNWPMAKCLFPNALRHNPSMCSVLFIVGGTVATA
jgi:hypothetical protein